jgi:hypothetical protein
MTITSLHGLATLAAFFAGTGTLIAAVNVALNRWAPVDGRKRGGTA